MSNSFEHAVSDREEWAECECVLALPDSYTEDGEETPLIISFHGAGSRVCEAENMVGGVKYVKECVDAGFAALDVCGSELHGLTMGCPEHMMAAYKAYRYAIKHFNLSERVLVAGASMGGHSAMNFANMFPGIVTSSALKHNVEINQARANKGEALLALAQPTLRSKAPCPPAVRVIQ